MALRAAALAVLAVLVLAAPATAQDQAVAGAVASLRSDEVHVDPGSRSILPADQERRVEREIAAKRPGPLYVAVLPAGAARAAGGSAAGVAQQVADGLGRAGVYVVVVGTDLEAGQVRGGLDAGEPARLAREAISDHHADPSRGRLGAILVDLVDRVAVARAHGGREPASGGGRGSGVGGGAGTGVLALLALVAAAGGLFAFSRARRGRREQAARSTTCGRRPATTWWRSATTSARSTCPSSSATPTRGPATRSGSPWSATTRPRRRWAARAGPRTSRPITQALEEGRYEMEVAKARLEGREPPERRPPCFFDPRHGPSVEDVEWSPPGGRPRPVPVCQADAVRVHEGLEPSVARGARRRHADAVLRAPGYFGPWAGGFYGGFGGGLLPGILLGTVLGGSLAGAGAAWGDGCGDGWRRRRGRRRRGGGERRLGRRRRRGGRRLRRGRLRRRRGLRRRRRLRLT